MTSSFRTPLALAALTIALLIPSPAAADEVTDWNQVLVSALTATATSPQNAGRIAAITQAAVFDAVNGIDRRYTPYFVTPAAPAGASRRAAAVQAAYVVLKALLPTQAAGLERQRDASIAAIAPRTHANFAEAADEANNSRVYGGIHFRTAVRDGRTIGDRVGNLVLETLMRPSDQNGDGGDDRDRH